MSRPHVGRQKQKSPGHIKKSSGQAKIKSQPIVQMNTQAKSTRISNAHITIFPNEGSLHFNDEEYETAITSIDKSKIQALTYQGEVAPTTNKQHIQMFAEFKEKQSYKSIKKIFKNDTIHIEPMTYGTLQDCRDYCTNKSNTKIIFKDTQTYGNPKNAKGTRTDLKSILTKMKEGISPLEQSKQDDATAKLYIQYHKGLDTINNSIQHDIKQERIKKELKSIKLRQFQEEINTLIQGKPDNRKIYWYYETIGNTGKSHMTKYLTAHHDAIMINTGKQADILHAYNHQPIIIFDLPRTLEQNESIYTTMEVLKNGHYFSSKYESKSVLTEIPHIIVFSNFLPDTSKLSKDRWAIQEIQSDYTTKSITVEDVQNRIDINNASNLSNDH